MKSLIHFIVLLPALLLSQERVIHYTTSNGLPHDVTFGIYQDSKGYIWMGTDNGLVKFDGHDFKVFTIDEGLRTNYVIDVAEDSNGQMILATWGGGIHTIDKDSVIIPKMGNDSLQKINNIELWNDHAIVKSIRGNYFYKKTPSSYERRTLIVKSEPNGNLLLAEPKIRERPNGALSVINNELIVYNGNSLNNRDKKHLYGLYSVGENWKLKNVFPFMNDKTIHSITAVGTNEYVASQQDSLFFFDNQKLRLKLKIETGDKEIEKIIKTIDNQYLLLASDNKGFKTTFMFDPIERTTIDFRTLLSSSSPISDILEDHEGNIWITTHGDGVYCYLKKDSDLKYMNSTILPEIDVKDITEVNKKVYVLTSNYVTSFIKTLKDDVIKLNGMGKHLLNYEDKELLVSSIGYHKEQIIKNVREINAYNSFFVDSLGLIMHRDSLYTSEYKKKGIVEEKIILDAVFYKDTLWFATNAGPYFYDKLQHILMSKNIADKKLSSSQIKKFLKTDESLWIATSNGLNLINDNDHFIYTKKEGLIDNRVNALFLDHRNHLWIGTQNGISVFNGQDFLGLTKETGLSSSYVQTIYEDSKSNMWIGGDKGVMLLNNRKELHQEEPPLINITQNNTGFVYNAISYNRTNSLLSEYKIGDNPWVATSSVKGIFDYDNFKKGTYTFQFRAKKQDSNWAYSNTYNFSVKVPWHKDWRWGLLLTMSISLLIISLIVKQLQTAKKRNKALKLSMDRKQELEEELSNVRENVARDFHDDLGNRLARISIFSNLLTEEDSKIDENEKELIGQISSDADYLFKGTKDFIFSLKSESDYLEEVITYLSDFGEEYFRQFEIDFVVNKNISRNIKLPYYWSKQLVFIFKEAMTNVVKHAKCDKVEISYTYDCDILTITCEDNGNGFDETILKSNHGVDNMKRRAEQIGGVLTVQSTINKGTIISFTGKTTPAV